MSYWRRRKAFFRKQISLLKEELIS